MDTGLTDMDDIATKFRAAMRRFASTVTIVTACDQDQCHGMTATAVTSLSMDPPSLLICLNQKTRLNGILSRTSGFCVNVLNRDQAALSTAFSGGVAPEHRFETGRWARRSDGIPYLADAQSRLFCRKAEAIAFGTHTILIGEVEDVVLGEIAAPLVYHNSLYCAAAPVA